MLKVFSEFKRAMICDRVLAGPDRARSSGKRLGGPRTKPFKVQRIRAVRSQGDGTTPEGECCQDERGQADVGDHGWVRTLDQPTSIRDRQGVRVTDSISIRKECARDAHSFMCAMTAMTNSSRSLAAHGRMANTRSPILNRGITMRANSDKALVLVSASRTIRRGRSTSDHRRSKTAPRRYPARVIKQSPTERRVLLYRFYPR
jgi:hypothetical protein